VPIVIIKEVAYVDAETFLLYLDSLEVAFLDSLEELLG
jgi:hypothetical protein